MALASSPYSQRGVSRHTSSQGNALRGKKSLPYNPDILQIVASMLSALGFFSTFFLGGAQCPPDSISAKLTDL